MPSKSQFTPQLVVLDEQGREIPDPTPMAVPAGFKVPETLDEQIRRLIRGAISTHADAQGAETFEESEDFDIDDDMFDPSSPYEEVFDPVLGRGITHKEFLDNQEVYRARWEAAQEAAAATMASTDALRGIPKAAPAPSSEGPTEPAKPATEA